MGGLFGGGSGAGNYNNRISAFKIEDVGYGVPVKIGYGSNKVTPVLIWQRDFKAIAHENSGGGKGFGGGGGGKSYTYTVSILYGLLEGGLSVRKYGKVWRDKKRYDTTAKAGFTFDARGLYPQTAWGYLTSKYPTEALAYNGIALLGATNYALSSSATLGQHQVEYFGRCLSETASDQNYIDAHIRDVIADFIENIHFGAIDQATATLTVWMGAMHDYCVARNLLISPIIDSQQEAQQYLAEWARIANSAIVYSEGILKFIPYADQDITGAFGSYVAETEIRANFDDSNLSEPVSVTRKKPADCYNKVTVEVLNRGFDYNKVTREAKDQASIENDGLRPNPETIVLNSVCVPYTASIVARTELVRGLYIRNAYQLKTSIDYDYLERMDFITITDTNLGLLNARCRITGYDDEPGENADLTLYVDEYPLGVSYG